MSVTINILSFTESELLLKVEDGVILKITGNNLKYSTLEPYDSYENFIEYKEKYVKNNKVNKITIIENMSYD